MTVPQGAPHPCIGHEGVGPVTKDVDEQLEDEDEADGQVELVGHLAQLGRRSVAERHLAAELRLEDAHEEVLSVWDKGQRNITQDRNRIPDPAQLDLNRNCDAELP